MITTKFLRPLLKTKNFVKKFTKEKSLLYKSPTIILGSVLVTMLLVALRQIEFFQLQELASFDQMVRLKPKAEIDPRILIVGITEEDIKNQNQWPINDGNMAQVLANLQKLEPKVIGLDLYRDIPQPPGHDKLLTQLKQDNVIAITQIGVVPPPPQVPEERVAFNDLVIDIDNVLRRNLMYAEIDSQSLYSFSLKVSLQYFRDQKLQFLVKPNEIKIGKAKFKSLKSNSGGYSLPESETVGWQILINYRRENIAPQISLTDVLQGKVEPSLVKDKIVLIGTTAPSIKDLIPTPYSAGKIENHLMPGVLVHAQMISQIIDKIEGKPVQLWYWEEWGENFWIFLWCFLAAITVWQLNKPLYLVLGIISALIILWGSCFIVFLNGGWIPLIPPAIGLIISSSVILAYKVLYSISYDILTGLPNRNLLLKQLTRINRNKKLDNQLLAVIFLDLDRFKIINESFGHEIGDKLLIETTKRLKNCLSSQAKLARVGGDEFAIILYSLTDYSEANQFADKLEVSLTRPFNLKEQEIYTTVSIGIAFNKTGEKLNAFDLFRDAHTAMYRAKALGKGRQQVFLTEMQTEVLELLKLENDLREAIKNKEFQLYYQPIICLKTGEIVGFESLIRWFSTKRGFVSPAEFIPVSEETGLIIPLGEWILEEACKQTKVWEEEFSSYPFLTVSINLSTRQFTQPNLLQAIENIIYKTGVDTKKIKLEITESMVMDNVEDAINLLNQIKELGISLSMDDFGTGYSSLSYLQRFPMDNIKIDQSFVRGMDISLDDSEIVRTIIMLGHNLGMKIIAEGIETQTHYLTLKELGCEYGQGYFFSKPLSSKDATELLKQNPQW